jgi:putative ABC transport system permease protein
MASRPRNVPQMVAVKAVDTSSYPFYGQPTVVPNLPLSDLLKGNCVVANEDMLIRFHVKNGDTIRLGGKEFQVCGTVTLEPDRLASGFGPSMRVMMSRASLERTGLLQPGSRAAERFLFRLNPGADIDKLKSELEQVLARPRITDFRDGDPAVEKGIERATTFLSLVSLIALIVGALGVGMAMYSHLQQKMDTIAVMKAVGGRSRKIAAIYLIETLWLGLAGGVCGIVIGALVQRSFPVLIHQVFALLPVVSWDWSFSLQGLALGVLATLLFTLPPMVGIWKVRPNVVLRREMNDDGRNMWRNVPYAATVAAIAAALAGTALWVSGSWRVSLYFIGGLAGSLLLLSALATLLLRLLRLLVARSGRALPTNFRHGLANLYRPGTHASAILVALGVGVVFTLTTYLIQHTVISDIHTEAPSRGGNVFLLDVRPSEREEVARFLRTQAGVERPADLTGYFVARMLNKNGVASEKLPLPKQRRDDLQTRRVSLFDGLPKGFEIVQGHIWSAGAKEPQVAISEEQMRRFQMKLGDELQFQAGGHLVQTRVIAIFRPEKQAVFRYDILYPTGALMNIPAIYFGSVQVTPSKIPDLEEALFERFPTITVMNLSEILQRIQEAVDQVALVIRFLAAFAIFAGVIILSSSVAGTRQRRVREVAILKTLGATRRRITAIFSVEFTILGSIAGLAGGLLANAFSALIATQYIEIPFRFDAGAVLVSILAMVILANLAGWLASVRLLQLKPLEILRAE